jgi:hypothetical protein
VAAERDGLDVGRVVHAHLHTIYVARRACPTCGGLKLGVGDAVDLPGGSEPVVPVVCGRCYQVRFFAWGPIRHWALAEAEADRRVGMMFDYMVVEELDGESPEIFGSEMLDHHPVVGEILQLHWRDGRLAHRAVVKLVDPSVFRVVVAAVRGEVGDDPVIGI